MSILAKIFNIQAEHISRSVHNIRIERLWRDVTRGFGAKWKTFFQELELRCRLNHNNDAHIWLLHYLFLPSINDDALEWASAWNRHDLSIRNERRRSPADMFFFGELQNGIRDMSRFLPEEDPVYQEEREGYGVDLEDLDDRDLLNHHTRHNDPNTLLEALTPDAVSDTHQPRHLSLVEVPDTDCPLTQVELDMLNDHLVQLPEFNSRDMRQRRSLWIQALQYINEVIFGNTV